MKLSIMIQRQLDKLSDEIKIMYGLRKYINSNDTALVTDKPIFINIKYDNDFHIEESECVFEIRNSKIIVSLWKHNFIMHVTVL